MNSETPEQILAERDQYKAAYEQLSGLVDRSVAAVPAGQLEVKVGGKVIGAIVRCDDKYYGRLLGDTPPTANTHSDPLRAAEDVLIMAQGKPAYTPVCQLACAPELSAQAKAREAFISVANGLAAAMDNEDMWAVYAVWRNIADALITAKPEIEHFLDTPALRALAPAQRGKGGEPQ